MKRAIQHFEQVDTARIQAKFFDDRAHRAWLRVPFLDRRTGSTLCIIGQNPSSADELRADQTIRFLERLVHQELPDVRELLVLNLYSRVDTRKEATADVLHEDCLRLFENAIRDYDDFLLVFGRPRKQKGYDFPKRAREVLLALESKSVLKLDLGTAYAPHPGNFAIRYGNFNVRLVRCPATSIDSGRE